MKMLNLGCGQKYHKDWTNIDFSSNKHGVIGHNLIMGIPFDDATFEVVYHSHVLEHFSRDKGLFFLHECFRVLKPNGVIRVVIPDLEQIVRMYLQKLDEETEADYDWMMLELFDQTVRNKSGGDMLEYLRNPSIQNADFVLSRIGDEGRQMLNNAQQSSKKPSVKKSAISKFWRRVKKLEWASSLESQIGRFRLGGEIHQWMYDRFSLGRLLRRCGFEHVERVSAYESRIHGFAKYGLDVIDGCVRKPDSLFMEATKPS